MHPPSGLGGSGVCVEPPVTTHSTSSDRHHQQHHHHQQPPPTMRPPKQPQSRQPGREIPAFLPVRPRFDHHHTNDRLREGLPRPPIFSMASNIRKDRKSVFIELGLDEYESYEATSPTKSPSDSDLPGMRQRASASTDRTAESSGRRDSRWTDGAVSPRASQSPSRSPTRPHEGRPWYAKLAPGRRPGPKTAASALPPTLSSLWRLSKVVLLIVFLVPILVMATVTRRLRSKTNAAG